MENTNSTNSNDLSNVKNVSFDHLVKHSYLKPPPADEEIEPFRFAEVKKESSGDQTDADELWQTLSSTDLKLPLIEVKEFACKRERLYSSPKDFFGLENYNWDPSISSDFGFPEDPKPPEFEDKTLFPTFRFFGSKSKLVLFPAEYPRVHLTYQQCRMLEDEVLESIVSPEGFRAKPRFFGKGTIQGCFVLTCGDADTVSWVKSSVKNMSEKIGIELKIINNPPVERSFVADGFFSNSQNESSEKMLRYIAAQNKELDVSRWKVLDRRTGQKRNEAIMLTILMDWKSAESINHKGPKLNYKLGAAKFVLRPFRDEDDDEEEYEMNFASAFGSPQACPDEKQPLVPEELLFPGLSHESRLPSFLANDGDYRSRIERMAQKAQKSLRNEWTSWGRRRSRKNWMKARKKRADQLTSYAKQTETLDG